MVSRRVEKLKAPVFLSLPSIPNRVTRRWFYLPPGPASGTAIALGGGPGMVSMRDPACSFRSRSRWDRRRRDPPPPPHGHRHSLLRDLFGPREGIARDSKTAGPILFPPGLAQRGFAVKAGMGTHVKQVPAAFFGRLLACAHDQVQHRPSVVDEKI
jgi:hypothetical protein